PPPCRARACARQASLRPRVWIRASSRTRPGSACAWLTSVGCTHSTATGWAGAIGVRAEPAWVETHEPLRVSPDAGGPCRRQAEGMRTGFDAAVDLYWIPLGAGGHC